jgi:purine-nucleoside phosphorylase
MAMEHAVQHGGAGWTTDAPFRKTTAMIETCRQAGILAVAIEAAALYTLAEST